MMLPLFNHRIQLKETWPSPLGQCEPCTHTAHREVETLRPLRPPVGYAAY
jgi:hypothetical protein